MEHLVNEVEGDRKVQASTLYENPGRLRIGVTMRAVEAPSKTGVYMVEAAKKRREACALVLAEAYLFQARRFLQHLLFLSPHEFGHLYP